MDLLIYGTAKISELVFSHLKYNPNYNVVAFVADDEYVKSDSYLGLPLFSFEGIEDHFSPSQYKMLCVGPYSNSSIREKMYESAKAKGYSFINYIDDRAIVSEDLIIGENNIVLPGVYIDCLGRMGNCNIFRPNSYIGHDFVIGNYNYFAPCSKLAGYVTVEEHCFLGIGSTIIERKTIACKTLVGAHSLILKDTEGGTYVGVPAKKL